MSQKIVMVLAPGFEEAEAVITADVLRRAGLQLVLAGLHTIEVDGAHNIIVKADTTLAEIHPEECAAVILPGGMPGSMNLRNSAELEDFTQKVYKDGGIVAAICAAPIALAHFGLLKDKTFTAYPGFEDYLNGYLPTGNMTEVDGRIITGKGPGAAFEFGGKIAAAMGKSLEAAQNFEGMFVKVN